MSTGRLLHCTFRGLLSVHSRYGLPARGVAEATLSIEGSGGFVTSTAAPIATGWSDQSCRAGFAPAEDPRLFTAHAKLELSVDRNWRYPGGRCLPWEIPSSGLDHRLGQCTAVLMNDGPIR